MRPCDCKERYTAMTQLNEQGIRLADAGIGLSVEPAVVILEVGSCTLKIPMRHFKRLAEWYLEDQEKPLKKLVPPKIFECEECGTQYETDQEQCLICGCEYIIEINEETDD